MGIENSICKYCTGRNQWECDDGWYPQKGCDSWCLDFDTLSKKQQEHLKNVLMNEVSRESKDD